MIIAKSFMKGIPFEITEAAKIDGAGDFYILSADYPADGKAACGYADPLYCTGILE